MTEHKTLSVQLFGGFRIASAHAVLGIDQPRLQRLLVYLLLHRRHPRARQEIAFTLWPDTNEEQALKNLRTLLTRLRQTQPELEHFLDVGVYGLHWRPDAPYNLDVAGFEAACAAAVAAAQRGETAAATAAYEHAVQLYTGDLTPGWYDEWIVPERERLRQTYLDALEQLARLLEHAGRLRDALGYAQQLLRTDPLHEAAYRQLMQLHLALDDRASALRVYHTCATTLRNELGVDPSPATQALYLRLLTIDDESAAQPQPAAAPAAAHHTPGAAALVGRQAEWATLKQAWQSAVAGRAQLVLISGEAGIGKTRLAEELLAWVERQGVATAVARCYASGGSLAYAPVAEWLRSPGRQANVRRLDGIWRSEAARLLPELLADRPDLPAPGPMTEAWQRQRFFQALGRAVLGATVADAGQTEAAAVGNAARPLLLFLDDLQWCDRDTLDWLHHLIEANANVPLFVLGAVRVEEAGEDHPLTTFRLALARNDRLHELILAPLNAAETAMLAAELLDHTLAPAQAAQLFQDTEGNPLFVVETVRAGMADGETRRAAEGVSQTGSPGAVSPAVLPPKVRAVIRRRLALLSPGAQALAQTAAVIGREFTFAVLARASGQDEAAVVQNLDELWRRQLVREQGLDAYDFSHDKIRAVAYVDLSPMRRRTAHLRVAEAIVASHVGNLDPVCSQIATHYAQAGQPQFAIDFYRRAVAAAQRIFAHRDALMYLEKAFNLLPTVTSDASRRAVAPVLQEKLGDIRETLTQHDAARTAYLAALADTPDDEFLTRARLHRKIGKILENEQREYAQVAAQYGTAAALLGAPTPIVTPAWWEEWCQVQLDQLLLLYWWGRTDEMGAQIAYVRPLIEQYGTPLQCASLFSNLGRQLARRNRFTPSDTVLEYVRTALEISSQSAGPELRAVYQFGFGFYLMWNGAFAEAVDALNLALDTAVKIGDLMLQARCLTYLALTHRLCQDAASTAAYARRGLAVAETTAIQEYIGANCANLVWAALKAGDMAEAERLLQRAVAAWHHEAQPYPLQWQALLPLMKLALARDALGEASAYAERLVDPHQQKLADPIEPLLLQAIAAWRAQDVAGARQFLSDAVDHAVSFGYL